MDVDLKNKVAKNKPNPLNDAEKEFIEANYKEFSAPQIAKQLHREPRRIYDYMQLKGIKPLNTNKFGKKRTFIDPNFFNENEMENWII